MVDAPRLVLEIGLLVHADLITASRRNYVMTLYRCVRTEAERPRAEGAAWAPFVVDKVINRIELSP